MLYASILNVGGDIMQLDKALAYLQHLQNVYGCDTFGECMQIKKIWNV